LKGRRREWRAVRGIETSRLVESRVEVRGGAEYTPFSMLNDDILRRLRHALEIDDAHTARLLSTPEEPVTPEHALLCLDASSDEDCPPIWLARFLDALVLERRGPRDPSAPPLPPPSEEISNNMVLKKIRIALVYKEEEMLETIARGGMKFSPAELTALFRKPGHKHFRSCGDELLNAFLTGLTERLRSPEAAS